MEQIYFIELYKKIIESLKLVASPAKEQINLFPDYVCIPDEIALTFDEIISYAKILVENNFITIDQYSLLEHLNHLFENFQKVDWTIESMYNSKKWMQTRQEAIIILKKFGESYSNPDIFWINYIKND